MSQMCLDITHFIYSFTAVAGGFIFALCWDRIRYTGEYKKFSIDYISMHLWYSSQIHHVQM